MIITLGILILLFVSLFAAFYFRQRRLDHEREQAALEAINTGVDIAQLQMVDGQQMSSESFNLTADLSAPASLQLPLKTLADFPATASAVTKAVIATNKGNIEVELYGSKSPLTVANFVTLAENGFYNGLHFHRVVPNFVAQIGDDQSRDVRSREALEKLGTGYPGYRIEDEFDPSLSHDSAGVLSMANINVDGSYPNSGGSQFFITLAPATYLDGRHAIFGRVTNGLNILPRLEVGDEIRGITLE